MQKDLQNNEIKNFLFYTTPNGQIKLEVFLQNETIWMNQEKIAILFGVQRPAITKHLKNIFEDWELDENVVSSILELTTPHGAIEWKTQIQKTKFYNLDAILSVWYRVNSKEATQFRIWANSVLKEYIIKGFAMNDEKLKDPKQNFTEDYFKELLERIRSIRTSERRIYQQITDIFEECTTDYNWESKTKQDFYAMIQNKFHFAITWFTAAEIIYKEVDKNKPFMWLKTWKNSPKWRIIKTDVSIAKNYLDEKEIKKLERTISSYFDYIENQIENKNSFTMEQLANSVNKFLEFNDFKILEWKWKITHIKAEEKAFLEYEEFNKKQKIESDFDREVKKYLSSQN